MLLLSYLFRFYSDEATWSVDKQFLCGPGLLITPVLDPVGLTFLMPCNEFTGAPRVTSDTFSAGNCSKTPTS